jgi:heme-degrading monooxygenase HmoA
MSTGKLIGSEDTLSADTLEKITETRWQSEDAFNQWKSDPICAEMVAGHIEYCVQNNITNTTESTQTV